MAVSFGTSFPLLARLSYSQTQTQIFFADSNMNGRVKSDGSSIGEDDDDIATVEETFDEEAETSSGLANTSPNSLRGSSPIIPITTLSHSKTTDSTSPTTAAVASVQAALAALQAGQMSLNQVMT